MLTYARTTRFLCSGATLCLLGLTGRRWGCGEELSDAGSVFVCISARVIQIRREVLGGLLG